MDPIKDQQKFLRAKERVEDLKKFYTNLMWFCIIIPVLAAINYYTNGFGYMWFLWAAFGWGIGLLFQAIKAFRLSPMFNKDWEDRKIKEFMNEEENETDYSNRWK
ncbi:MAG: 2TM domain-containing protein [Gilvibacter sp.]